VTLRTDADIEQAFEVSQVVVVGPEERGEAVLADGDAACGNGSDRDISLCCKELTDSTRVAPQPLRVKDGDRLQALGFRLREMRPVALPEKRRT
jgi:hypothetical protein